jgi:polyisoprenoid-binding protein YceI
MSGIATFDLDARISRFQAQAFAGGMLSALGHDPVIGIRGLAGEASLREGTLDDASLVVRVDPRSLRMLGDISDRDRSEIERTMHGEVLETDRYPEITFASTRVEMPDKNQNPVSVVIEGSLTLHGQTRAISIPAKVSVQEGQIRAFGDFSLRQSDFGIHPITVGGGTLKVKDELKLTFDIVARRRGDESANQAA